MSRIAVGLLVAATAGVLSWWVNYQRAAGGSQRLAFVAEPTSFPRNPLNEPGPDPEMVVTPKGDIDPNMIKTMPDVDPKMVVTPPWPPKPLDRSTPEKQ